MRLYNQTKNALSWSMSGDQYECEPWGSVEIPEDFVHAVESRGLPLGPVQVAPEIRAGIRIADEKAEADEAPLLALRKQADEAAAREKQALLELELCQKERDTALSDLRQRTEELAAAEELRARAEADRAAAETLLSETSSKATDSEARAIKAEALLAELTKPEPQAAEVG